jgi:hypothetical protein
LWILRWWHDRGAVDQADNYDRCSSHDDGRAHHVGPTDDNCGAGVYNHRDTSRYDDARSVIDDLGATVEEQL